jgi:hypothetical protein
MRLRVLAEQFKDRCVGGQEPTIIASGILLMNSHSCSELCCANLGISRPPFFAKRLRFLYWVFHFARFVSITQITISSCPSFTLRSASCSALSESEYTDMKGEGILLRQYKWSKTMSRISGQSGENLRVDLFWARMPLLPRRRAHEVLLSTRKNVVGVWWLMASRWLVPYSASMCWRKMSRWCEGRHSVNGSHSL